jgi:phosphatidate cytidylyltransferase
MSSVRKRILTGSTLILAVVLFFVLDRRFERPWVVWGLAVLLSSVGAYEIAHLGRFAALHLGFPLAVVVVVLGLSSFPADIGLGAARPWWVNLVTAPVLAGGYAWIRCRTSRLAPTGTSAHSASLAAWLVPGLYGLVEVRQQWGSAGLLAFVALAKVGDNTGYLVGRFLGRHHPLPRLSPGKTVEGFAASFLGALALGAILAEMGGLPTSSRSVALGMFVAALINVAAQAGDLLESWIKRRAGVKDSSTLLGASGGVLDVVDSLLLSVPVALTFWPLLL